MTIAKSANDVRKFLVPLRDSDKQRSILVACDK